MFLKLKVKSLDEVEKSLHGFYQEQNGEYVLAIEGLEDTGALKRAKEHEKQARLDAEKRLEEIERKAREAEAAAEEAKQKAVEEAARKSGDFAALEKSWSEKLSKREAELKAQIDGLSGNINNLLVDNVAAQIANEIGLDGSAQILIPHIKSRLAAEQRDGKFVTVVKDAEGKLSASTLDDLKTEFTSNAVFAPVLRGNKASGGGAGAGKGGGAAGGKTIKRSEFDSLDAAGKASHLKAGGAVID